MDIKTLADKLRPTFIAEFERKPFRPCRVFLSATDMKSRAVVRHASDPDPNVAFDHALEQLLNSIGSSESTILRADWITDADSMTWDQLLTLVGQTRRNYFKRGIALSPDFSIAFTECELNANLMLYDKDNPNGALNVERAKAYCRIRFNRDFPMLKPGDPVVVFDTNGAFIIDGEESQLIDGAKHRHVSPIDPEQILLMARNGADHLARQIQDDGRFVYGLMPCDDRIVPSYNTLRHFSSLFAMLDVYETYPQPNEQLRRAIIRGVDHAVKKFIRWFKFPDGTQAAYIEEPEPKEFKLGTLGIAVATLAKVTEIMRTPKYLLMMKALARGILSTQNDDGSFLHVLNSSDFSVKEPFRSVNYDGQAVFGLMKLYSLTHDQKLLDASTLAFDHFIDIDHWQYHDHWIEYAVNELTKYEPRADYFEFGVKNFADHLQFVRNRDTQYPTLMELMMAADAMLERVKLMPDVSELLSMVDFDDFYAAMEALAANMLNGYFYPEFAMYFARPESISGAFFIRHHEFRARNDDIEHFLSGFVAYRRYLARRAQLIVETEKVVETSKAPEVQSSSTAEIFFGGIVNLGRRMHWRVKVVKTFGDIPAMRNADLRLVELFGVVSSVGECCGEKGTGDYHFFRARPEQLNILTDANIDVGLTANHHSGDYGVEALIDQNNNLDRAGIQHAGTGKNFEEASKPVYVKVKNLVVAIFSIDATTSSFAATNDGTGNFYLPLGDAELWKVTFDRKIADAKRHADIVLVSVDWEIDADSKPSDQLKAIGHQLIDCGADAVLGCHSCLLNNVEVYNGRPIIYGAGLFLFDKRAADFDSGGFMLTIDRDGVRKLKFIALRGGDGFVLPAGSHSDRINKKFLEACRALGNDAAVNEEGVVEIDLNPPARGVVDKIPLELPAVEKHLLEPLSEPRPEWTIERVPEEALIAPIKFGALTMVGYHIPPECRTLTKYGLLYVETYWTLKEPIKHDFRLQLTGVPVRECRMGAFGVGMAHDFCDWLYPTERWTPGIIYKERIGLRPPPRLSNVDVRMEVRIWSDGRPSEPFIDPNLVKVRIPDLPYYRTEYPNAICKSKLGRCWTAEQLEAATGGKWIVPPPAGWFVQSIVHHIVNAGLVKAPRLFITSTRAQRDLHNQVAPSGVKDDNYSQVVSRLDKLAGAVVDHKLDNLPPDFPQLLVDDPLKAAIEIGFAARKRFQGKMIGVTGSNGKTTTCEILKHVLGQEHDVEASYDSINSKLAVPIVFANVKQETAFAIIELSINAMNSMRGSITYDIPPHIAVVTSIFEVHLENSGSLENIARSKCKIFNGMAPGGYAVLNRDMNYYEVFEQKARSKELNLITFGTHPESMIRMNPIANGGSFEYDGKTYTLECPVPNDQLYDALAVVGVSIAAGYSLEKTLEYLKTFEAVKGRGNLISATYNGKSLRLIDSTYNANVASITGTLSYLKTLEPDCSKRVAFLGDIAELGSESVRSHLELVEPILQAAPDRVVFAGKFMKNVWQHLEGKLKCAWFPSYKELIESVDDWLRDGDTVLLKSSHSTNFEAIVKHLCSQSAAPIAPTLPPSSPVKPTLNVPSALFDVSKCLPEGITPALNGRLPSDRLGKTACGGLLYIDAARSLEAMVDAAEHDGVFISINHPFNCYRTLNAQAHIFRKRFTPLDAGVPVRAQAARVEFEGKMWQLDEGKVFAQVPGQSSHSYGLAVDIQNEGVRSTRQWLNANAEQFGFIREFDFESWHFTYVRGLKGVSDRVLEYEAQAPHRTWTAAQIVEASGCQWYGDAPTADWTCRGLLSVRPLKIKMLTVFDPSNVIGFDKNLLKRIFRQCAGFVCTSPDELLEYKQPLLVTNDLAGTVQRLNALFNGD